MLTLILIIDRMLGQKGHFITSQGAVQSKTKTILDMTIYRDFILRV